MSEFVLFCFPIAEYDGSNCFLVKLSSLYSVVLYQNYYFLDCTIKTEAMLQTSIEDWNI